MKRLLSYIYIEHRRPVTNIFGGGTHNISALRRTITKSHNIDIPKSWGGTGPPFPPRRDAYDIEY